MHQRFHCALRTLTGLAVVSFYFVATGQTGGAELHGASIEPRVLVGDAVVEGGGTNLGTAPSCDPLDCQLPNQSANGPTGIVAAIPRLVNRMRRVESMQMAE